MSMDQKTEKAPRPRRAHRGQTLIVALAILFILLFIGGIFVAQVARNIGVAGRSRDTQNSRQLAEAGLHFCDNELTYSADGADWRPQPTVPLASDPDAFWLTQGFARIELRGGRALVRVVYGTGKPGTPHNTQLRIESIGLPGDVSGNDPTLLVQNGLGQRLRSERTAYKQLGLTDFLMYITNPDHRQYENFLGSPPVGVPLSTVFGDPNTVTNPNVFNGGMQINGSVRWGGYTFIYADPAKGEGVTVANDVLLAPTFDLNSDGVLNDADLQAFINMPPGDPDLLKRYDDPVQDPVSPARDHAIYPSSSANFSTIGGILRDGSTLADKTGAFRNASFLEPPSIVGQVAGSGVLRYRALTRDSGFWFKDPASGQTLNTGFFGWGDGIYVDNFEDLQRETQVATGGPGKSLRSEWVHPEDSSNWNGPYYTPPGAEITFLGDHILLTRHDSRPIRKTDGQPVTGQGGKQILIPLLDADRKKFIFPDGTDPTMIGPKIALPNLPHNGPGTDVTIMLEGNVRLKGYFGVGANAVHVNVITGGTAYVDGNLVKGDDKRLSTCAVLAKDYVAVNTSQFVTSEKASWTADPQVGQANRFFYSEVEPGADRDNIFSYSSGLALNPNPYNTPIYLMLRHAATTPAGVAINVGINMGQAAGAFYTFQPQNSFTDVLGINQAGQVFPNQVQPSYEQAAFDLTASAGSISPFPGVQNALTFQIDPQYQLPGEGNYAVGGVMVAPMDIRIEALLFAQDKSFFIIPGYFLNRDSSDTRENAALNNGARTSQPLFPFYNEPTDVRLTIYGAIAQNYTASIGDQAAWQAHWGYIPDTFGSSGASIPSVHLAAADPTSINPNDVGNPDHRTVFDVKARITRGIRYLYDPSFALAGGAVRFQNVVINGQPVNVNLPPIPRLPVCPGLLYSGDSNSPIGGY